jgi:aspartokinase/homoserine dehydrogenase 1
MVLSEEPLFAKLLNARPHILARKNLDLNICAVAYSEKIWLDTNGISDEWETKLSSEGQPYAIAKVLRYAHLHALENLIAVDNTDSESFVDNYFPLIKGGFDLVSAS